MVENLNDNVPMFFSDRVMVEEVQVNVTEQQVAGTVVIRLEVRHSYQVSHTGWVPHFCVQSHAIIIDRNFSP